MFAAEPRNRRLPFTRPPITKSRSIPAGLDSVGRSPASIGGRSTASWLRHRFRYGAGWIDTRLVDPQRLVPADVVSFECLDQRSQIRGVMLPAIHRSLIKRLPHLPAAGGRHRADRPMK